MFLKITNALIYTTALEGQLEITISLSMNIVKLKKVLETRSTYKA
jgi:hypothetical protein